MAEKTADSLQTAGGVEGGPDIKDQAQEAGGEESVEIVDRPEHPESVDIYINQGGPDGQGQRLRASPEDGESLEQAYARYLAFQAWEQTQSDVHRRVVVEEVEVNPKFIDLIVNKLAQKLNPVQREAAQQRAIDLYNQLVKREKDRKKAEPAGKEGTVEGPAATTDGEKATANENPAAQTAVEAPVQAETAEAVTASVEEPPKAAEPAVTEPPATIDEEASPGKDELTQAKERTRRLQEQAIKAIGERDQAQRERDELKQRLNELEEKLDQVLKELAQAKAGASPAEDRVETAPPPAEETETAAADEGDEAEVAAEEEAAAVQPTEGAASAAVNELLAEYVPEAEKVQGWARGGLAPLIGAIGGGWLAEAGIGAFELAGKVPVPGLAAIIGAVSSLGASVIRSKLGEHAFSLAIRYSHTEGGKGVKGKLLKVGRMLARGAERAVLKRSLGLEGLAGVEQLLGMYDEQGNLTIPSGLNREYVEGLTRDGMWYALGTEAGRRLGAYYTPEEEAAINANRDRVVKAMDEIFKQEIPDNEKEAVLARIKQELIDKEKRVHREQVLKLAAISGAKALVLSGVGAWVAERLPGWMDKLGEVFGGAKEKAGGLAEQAQQKLGGGGAEAAVQNLPTSVREAIDHEIPSRVLNIQKTVGHTLADNGFKPEWGNLNLWQLRLLANDAENPSFWENAAKIARAITANPEGQLGGLDPETYQAALGAAQRTAALLVKAGYNENTHELTNAQAVLGDLGAIKDLFHWVYNGQAYLEPTAI